MNDNCIKTTELGDAIEQASTGDVLLALVKSQTEFKTIKEGQTLTARSVCDNACIFTAFVLERHGVYVTVKVQGRVKRLKVYSGPDGEFIYAMGKYSMCPIFRAI